MKAPWVIHIDILLKVQLSYGRSAKSPINPHPNYDLNSTHVLKKV